MPDRVSIELLIGSWVDVAENRGLVQLGGFEMFPMVESTDEFVRGVVSAAQKTNVNPWEHELRVKAYYANAAGEGWDLILSIAPFVDGPVTIEVAKIMAGAFLGAAIQNLLHVPNWLKKEEKRSINQVTEQMRDFLVKRDNLSPTQMSFVSTSESPDGGFEALIKRATDDHLILLRTDAGGLIVGAIDLTEWMSYCLRVESGRSV